MMDRSMAAPTVSSSHDLQHRALAMLPTSTYADVCASTGLSKGAVYRLALASGSRNTEQRIRERAVERRVRQEAALREIIGTTVKADVLDFLSGIPDDSIALHVSSPPYNLGKGYGSGASADTMRFTYYHGWLMQVISELARTVKPGGIVALNLGRTRDWTDTLMPLDVLVFEDLRRAGLNFQSRIIWTVPHGLTPKRRLAERYETVLVFSKGEPVFNPNAARTPQKNPAKRAYHGQRKGELSGHPLGSAPTDVWTDIPSIRHNG